MHPLPLITVHMSCLMTLPPYSCWKRWLALHARHHSTWKNCGVWNESCVCTKLTFLQADCFRTSLCSAIRFHSIQHPADRTSSRWIAKTLSYSGTKGSYLPTKYLCTLNQFFEVFLAGSDIRLIRYFEWSAVCRFSFRRGASHFRCCHAHPETSQHHTVSYHPAAFATVH